MSFARTSRAPYLLHALCAFFLLAGSAHASDPAPKSSTAKYEVDFMENMIDHHAMGAQMAKLCERKAVHGDLRELCTDIVQAQTQEIRMMQSWLSGWYSTRHSPQLTQDEKRQLEKLSNMPSREFEIAFMKTISGHHRIAIARSSVCLQRAYHHKLADLCKSIIRTQLDELDLMETWLHRWYGICLYDHRA